MNFERINNSKLRSGTAIAAAALMLSGCGIGSSKKEEGIPDCPGGYETQAVVRQQGNVIAAYEAAGQQLASEYKLAPAGKPEKRRLGVAYVQLFNEHASSHTLIQTESTTALGPDSYLADDPSELMCHTEDSSGEEVTVLSPNAIEAKTILKSVGITVKLNGSVR
jgi:hypothetical protein